MEKYVVSARKYRPARFDEVIGQEGVTTTLKNAIKSQHLAQSFLFCGPRGVGKTTTARILAKTINCDNISPDFEACNECDSCQSFSSNSSFNIHELDAASNNSVDDIRSLIDQVRFAPQEGKYKIYIIDEVHMLSQAAFNAFLKTLEEPPSYAIFILATTEKHKIIPTILSRCQIFDFSRIRIADTKAHLATICKEEGITFDDNALHIIAQKADGALRDALSMFDRLVDYNTMSLSLESVLTNLNILDHDYYFKVLDHLLVQDLASVMMIFDDILNNGFDGDEFISGLMEHFRNLMVCTDERTAQLLEVSGDLKERYHEQANLVPHTFLLNALNIANSCEVSYKTSKNKRLHVELALMKMCYIPSVVKFTAGEMPAALPKKEVSAPPVMEKPAPKPVVPAKEEKAPVQEQVNEVVPPAEETKEEKQEASVTTTEPNDTTDDQAPTDVHNEPEKNEDDDKGGEPVAEKPSPKPTPEGNERKDYLKGAGGSMNLSELTGSVKLSELDKVEEKQEEEEEAVLVEGELEKPEGDIVINLEAFAVAWKSYVQLLKEEKRNSIAHVMEDANPRVENGDVFITLDNKLQQELIDNERVRLVGFLKEQLNVHYIGVKLNITKREKKRDKRHLSSTEKLKLMAEKNPAIKELQKKLDLRIDH